MDWSVHQRHRWRKASSEVRKGHHVPFLLCSTEWIAAQLKAMTLIWNVPHRFTLQMLCPLLTVLSGKFWNLAVSLAVRSHWGRTLGNYNQSWLQFHSLLPGLSACEQILSHAPATMSCDVYPHRPTIMDWKPLRLWISVSVSSLGRLSPKVWSLQCQSN